MNDIRLTGLIGSNPLGALAAFGLLRVCSDIPALSNSRLYWTQEYDWIAVLRAPDGFGKGELLEKLAEQQKTLDFSAFNWSKDIRVAPDDYRAKLDAQAKGSTLCNRLNADYFAAFGSDIVSDGSKGLVKPTAFYMTSGQQKFLDAVCDIGNSLQSDSCKEAYEEALFGPWRYTDEYHSLGWDPAAERLHALRYLAPTREHARCVRAAVWLAVEALPLYPTAASDGRLATTGFVRQDRNTMLVWPIWTPPIGIDTLRSLIMTSDESSLKRRGVAAVYRSIRSKFGQGYAILRPAIEYS